MKVHFDALDPEALEAPAPWTENRVEAPVTRSKAAKPVETHAERPRRVTRK